MVRPRRVRSFDVHESNFDVIILHSHLFSYTLSRAVGSEAAGAASAAPLFQAARPLV